MLPTALVRMFPGCGHEHTVAAASVGEMVDALDRCWPGMRDRLCESALRVRRHINIFVDEERATLDTRLMPGARVLVMTAISGG
jgi:molybdopterin converting factor small subunit